MIPSCGDVVDSASPYYHHPHRVGKECDDVCVTWREQY
jgi:hypothetical protein